MNTRIYDRRDEVGETETDVGSVYTGTNYVLKYVDKKDIIEGEGTRIKEAAFKSARTKNIKTLALFSTIRGDVGYCVNTEGTYLNEPIRLFSTKKEAFIYFYAVARIYREHELWEEI